MQQKPFVEIGEDLVERIVSSIEAELDMASTQYLQVSAAVRPPGDPPPPAVSVPRGFGFYFSRAINNGWTDNRDAGQRPLEGFNFEEGNEYVPRARRAQLVARLDDQWYAGFEPSLDHSTGGRSVVENDTQGDWSVRWYMNDSLNAMNNGQSMYSDNSGTANIDMVVYRI